MASKLIESNQNRFVEAAWGQYCATFFGRQGNDNHSASDAEHARFARELAATAIENQMYLLTDVCGEYIKHSAQLAAERRWGNRRTYTHAARGL